MRKFLRQILFGNCINRAVWRAGRLLSLSRLEALVQLDITGWPGKSGQVPIAKWPKEVLHTVVTCPLFPKHIETQFSVGPEHQGVCSFNCNDQQGAGSV